MKTHSFDVFYLAYINENKKKYKNQIANKYLYHLTVMGRHERQTQSQLTVASNGGFFLKCFNQCNITFTFQWGFVAVAV
jgi:hypothetical protein